MLDHDVFPIIRVAGHKVRVHNFAVRNGAYVIERFTACIASQRFDVDSFVEAGVNDARRCLNGVTNEPVLPTVPRSRLNSFEIPLDILVKCWPASRKKGIVVCWQDEIENGSLGLGHHREMGKKKERNYRSERPHCLYRLCWPSNRQSFFIELMSAAVSPEAM